MGYIQGIAFNDNKVAGLKIRSQNELYNHHNRYRMNQYPVALEITKVIKSKYLNRIRKIIYDFRSLS